jgi:hypothetical protein
MELLRQTGAFIKRHRRVITVAVVASAVGLAAWKVGDRPCISKACLRGHVVCPSQLPVPRNAALLYPKK